MLEMLSVYKHSSLLCSSVDEKKIKTSDSRSGNQPANDSEWTLLKNCSDEESDQVTNVVKTSFLRQLRRNEISWSVLFDTSF